MATDLNKVKQSLGLAIYQALNVRPDKDPRRDLQTGEKLWIRAAGPMVDYLYASGVRSWNLTLQQVTDNGSYTNHRIQVDASGSRFYDLSITSGSLEMFNHKIIHLTDPTNPQDAATKNYIDEASGSIGRTQSLQSVTDIGNTTTKDITAANLKSNADIYINYDGPDGDSFLYFYENGVVNGAYLMWDDSESEFVLSHQLKVPVSGSTFSALTVYDRVQIGGTTSITGTSENFTTGGWGKALEFENDDAFMWKKGAGSYSWGMGGASDGNWYLMKSTADDASQASTAIMKIEGASDIVSYTGQLRTGSHLSINYDGPDGDSFIYFYDGGSETGEYLKWDESDHSFEFSDDLFVVNLFAREYVYINHDGGEGDSFLYFYEGGSAQGAYLEWDDSHGFRFSHDLFCDGHIVAHNNIYTNFNGGEGDSFLYFYEGGSPTGAHLMWDDSSGSFAFNKGLNVGSANNFTEIKDDGEINLHGTARVKRDIWLNVMGLKAPVTDPATLVDYGIGDAWEFTDGTDDTVVGRVKLPEDVDKSAGIEVLVGWNTETASVGNCVWQIEHLLRQENEAMDGTPGTLTQTVAASTTAKGLVVSSIGTITPHADDVCVTIKVKRRADLGADTLNEDNHLFWVGFKYTSNKLGEAT